MSNENKKLEQEIVSNFNVVLENNKDIIEYFKDIVFLYSFIASILYAILFYFFASSVGTNELFNYLDIIVILVFWILYLIISSKSFFIAKKKNYKFSLGYGIFV